MVSILAEGEIWTVPSVLTPDECRAVIAQGETVGFEAAAVRTSGGPQKMEGVRNNDRVVFDDPALAELLWARVRESAPPGAEGETASGLFQPFRLYRYDPGQRFKRHKDGSETTDAGERSRFTLLVYLNADCGGGETIFSDYTFEGGQGTRHEIIVTPEAGTALFFKHERWHEGAPVTAGRKYVLRTDVLYKALPTKEG